MQDKGTGLVPFSGVFTSKFNVVGDGVSSSSPGGSFDLTRYERRLRFVFKASSGGLVSLG